MQVFEKDLKLSFFFKFGSGALLRRNWFEKLYHPRSVGSSRNATLNRKAANTTSIGRPAAAATTRGGANTTLASRARTAAPAPTTRAGMTTTAAASVWGRASRRAAGAAYVKTAGPSTGNARDHQGAAAAGSGPELSDGNSKTAPVDPSLPQIMVSDIIKCR